MKSGMRPIFQLISNTAKPNIATPADFGS